MIQCLNRFLVSVRFSFFLLPHQKLCLWKVGRDKGAERKEFLANDLDALFLHQSMAARGNHHGVVNDGKVLGG